ncbi:MAG: cob(I)yrinic acid a,c-diamide adenosyltransferase [Thermoplasmata archaeon]
MSTASGLGKIHVITGPGRGKTTAAFGLAMRAAGHGLRVCIVQFMKTAQTTGEVLAAKRVKGIEIAQFGTGKFIEPGKVTKKDLERAREGVEHARRVLANGKCQLLILDEINLAVSFGLVSVKDVLKILDSSRAGVEIVLTGRNAPEEFVRRADYVSVIESRKHPFDKGTRARQGIEW